MNRYISCLLCECVKACRKYIMVQCYPVFLRDVITACGSPQSPVHNLCSMATKGSWSNLNTVEDSMLVQLSLMVLLQYTLYLYSDVLLCLKYVKELKPTSPFASKLMLIPSMLLFVFGLHIVIKSAHLRKGSVKPQCCFYMFSKICTKCKCVNTD